MPEIGEERSFVEYIDCAKGIAAIKKGGGDPDNDTMWDFCDQCEITVRKEFTTRSRAIEWARRNKKLDVFHMPRIVEETFQERFCDDRHHPVKSWEQTGYWEMDGKTTIEGDQ
jgi:hypothetical protein